MYVVFPITLPNTDHLDNRFYIGNARAGAVPSFIAVELSSTGRLSLCSGLGRWKVTKRALGLLWVLWLATAGTTASANFTGGHCGDGSTLRKVEFSPPPLVANRFVSWLVNNLFGNQRY